jgi:DNA repair protein RadC
MVKKQLGGGVPPDLAFIQINDIGGDELIMPITYPEGGISGITMRQKEQQKAGNGNNHPNNHMNNVRVQLITTRSIPKTKLMTPQEVYEYVRSSMEDLDREYAKVILLDTLNRVIGTETISIGSLNASIVHPREAVKSAILSDSASVIFLHSHPSGACEPSSDDRQITGILTKAFSDLGIKLLDSLIIGKGCYYSFLEAKIGAGIVGAKIGAGRSTETGTEISEYRNQYRIGEPAPNNNSISQALEKISIDTERPTLTQEYQVIGAAIPMNGYLVAYHLTDTPDETIRRLRADNLVGLNPYGDMGGGFYVSSVPQYWRARSRGKWEFATKLNMQQRQRLINVILSDPRYRKGGGYLADFELERLYRDLNAYITTGDVTYLAISGGQPYNVTITEEITRKAGIPPPREPGLVEVRLKGKFIDGEKLYSSGYYNDLLKSANAWASVNRPELLKEVEVKNTINALLGSKGYSGMFTKSGFSTNPEMVIWDRKAIVGIRKVT